MRCIHWVRSSISVLRIRARERHRQRCSGGINALSLSLRCRRAAGKRWAGWELSASRPPRLIQDVRASKVGAGVIHHRATIIRVSMTDEIPDGPGIATLVVPMPGSVRPPSDTVAAMLSWLSAHGAPRTAEVLGRLRRHAWAIELPDPDAATQSELIAKPDERGAGRSRCR
jgi:hypothetical protein